MKTISLKKFLACFMATLVLLTSLSISIATANSYGDFEYSVATEYDKEFNAIKSIKITKYNGSDSDVVIPDTIDSLPVTIIESDAFANNESIESVTIPETVVEIGGWAFENCTNLKEIDLPSNLKEIGGYILSQTAYELDGKNWDGEFLYVENYLLGCTDEVAGDVKIKDGTKVISGFAFSHNSDITSVEIPASVKSINICAFSDCENLKSVKLNEGLEIIGYAAFENTSIESITAPSTLKLIDGYAFCNTKITSFNVGANVEDLDDSAFYGCTSLKEIIVDSANENYYSVDGILFEKSRFSFMGDTISIYPSAKEGATYTIPENVGSIGFDTFSNLVYLKELNIPANVISFFISGSTNLERVNISDECEDYKSVDGIVYTKSGNGLVCYPNGRTAEKYTVADIAKEAYSSSIVYNPYVKEITFPEGFEYVKDRAVRDCENLETINLPSTLTALDNNFVNNCKNLTTVNFNNTKAQWDSLGASLSGRYNHDVILVCTDGTFVLIEGEEYVTIPSEPVTTEPTTTTAATEPASTAPADNTKPTTTPAESVTTEPSEGNTNATNPEKPALALGDVNGDNKLNIKDATTIQKYLANLLDLDNEAFALADFTEDGKVNIKDATSIQKKIAGLI